MFLTYFHQIYRTNPDFHWESKGHLAYKAIPFQHRHHSSSNDDVQRLMKQPKVTAIIQLRRLPCLGISCAWTTTLMPRGSCWPPLRQTGEENRVVPALRGLAPSNRIQKNTTLRSPKQQIWLRTTLCGGLCRRMVQHYLRVACQKWRLFQHTWHNEIKGFLTWIEALQRFIWRRLTDLCPSGNPGKPLTWFGFICVCLIWSVCENI